ncbi:MAG: signal peptidase I [Candidatus Nomurabacteria bacterium]|jgi:signal peptidase I|nr:signal peptidase I [Candidatus Nomurabacteria bacterium]
MDQNLPLKKHPEQIPQPAAPARYPWLRDVIGLLVFIAAVIVGATIINAIVFRSFSVIGPSMEDTLYTNERIIVNRLPVTWAALSGHGYSPSRGEIIVFKNPQFSPGNADEYIVKRVVGLPGERVTVNDCRATVYNHEHPNGFNPYDGFDVSDRNDCITGKKIDFTVPTGELFVIGDHRNGSYSHDSRNGLGDPNGSNPSGIPISDVVGPVGARIWPLQTFRFF